MEERQKNLLANLELDIHELAYLVEALGEKPDRKLKDVVQRNILRIREQLDMLYNQIDPIVTDLPDEQAAVECSQTTGLSTSCVEVNEPAPALPEQEGVEEEITGVLPDEIPQEGLDRKLEEEAPADVSYGQELHNQPQEEENNPEQEELEEPENSSQDRTEFFKQGQEEEQQAPELPVSTLKEQIKAYWLQKYFTEEKRSGIPLKQLISLSDSFYFSRICFRGETQELFRLLDKIEKTAFPDEAMEDYIQSLTLEEGDEEQYQAAIELGARIYSWFRDKE